MQSIGNGAFEVNPIANFFITRGALLQFKLIVLGFVSFYLIIRAKRNFKGERRVTKLLYFSNVLYILIVLINLIVNHNLNLA